MKKFNFLTQSKEQAVNEKAYKYQTYSSTLKAIGDGDLTKPQINTMNTSDSVFVRFGIDNLFPQLIDQMYYQSPLHSSIIDFQVNAAIGGGFDITTVAQKSPTDKVEELTFLKKIKAPKLLRGIALDIKMHRRFHLKVTKKGNEVLKIERLHPAKVRYNKSASRFWISDDWTGYSSVKEYGEYSFADTLEKEIQIYSYIDLESSPGQDVYPLDRAISAFNWCYLDGQSANLQKDNIQRSIFGNIIIKRPTEFKSTEEFDIFKRGIESKQGEIVPVLLLSADGKDNLPEVESFPANENDKAFANMDKRIDDKICQAHTINPAVMGIERPGSLGSGSDIKEAYPIWEKNVVMPFREQIEEIMNDVMFLFKIKGNFELKDFSIINGEVTEIKEEAFSEDGTPSEATPLNDNLRGLSASQNSDIYRIIRDHSRDKLNTAIASARLAAYGLDVETIEEVLKQDNL